LSIPVILLIVAAVQVRIGDNWSQRRICLIRLWIARRPERLIHVILAFISFSILVAFYLGSFHFSVALSAPLLLKVTTTKFSGILLLALLAPLEASLLLVLTYHRFLDPGISRATVNAAQLLIWPVLLVGGLQCLILVLRSDLLFHMPGWFWEETPKSFRISHLLLLPFYVIAIAGFERVSRSEAPNWYKLMLSVVLLLRPA